LSSVFYPDPVTVTVSLETAATEIESFGTPLFIVPHNVYTDTRIQSYTSLTTLTDAGFAVGSAPYKYAALAFGGKFPPSLIKIGRAPLTAYVVDFTGYTQTGDQIITLANGTTTVSLTNTYDVADTATDIAAAFAALIEADTTFGGLVDATSALGVLTIAPTLAATPISVGIQAGYASLEATSTETPTDTYEACKDEDTNFFWVGCQDKDKTKQQTLAVAVNADKKIFTYSTEDSACLAKGDTTNIGYLLQSASLDWACGMYHEHANMYFPEGAIVGAAAGTDFDNYGPDSLHLKAFSSLTTSTLTTTQREAIESYNLNSCITYRSSSCFFNGFMASGQFVDTMKFAAWLDARITESLFGLMYRNSNAGRSLTFSANDLPKLENAIRNSPINVGIRLGSILDGSDVETGEVFDPVISIPTRGQVPSNDLANRILNNVQVSVVYNNPLHYVRVNAVVQLTGN